MIWGLGGECIPLLESTLARNMVRHDGQNPFNSGQYSD